MAPLLVLVGLLGLAVGSFANSVIYRVPRHLSVLRPGSGNQGFTLIGSLVVVAIVGVLVAIAIPAYLNHRKSEENKSAQTDVRNAIAAIEQCYNDNGNVYPVSMPAVVVAPAVATLLCGALATGSQKLVVSPGNSLRYTNLATLPGRYKIVVSNKDTANIFTYTSFNGVTVKT